MKELVDHAVLKHQTDCPDAFENGVFTAYTALAKELLETATTFLDAGLVNDSLVVREIRDELVRAMGLQPGKEEDAFLEKMR